MTTKNLLVELFVEELPPKALKKLGEAFAAGLRKGLQERNFLENTSVSTAFASPRRLAVHISNVRVVSAPREMPARPLMPVSVGLDKFGKRTAPLDKKLRALFNPEVDLDWLMRERVNVENDGGKQVLMLKAELAPGGSLLVGLEGALESAVESLPIPKVMEYQLADGWTSVKFVRPAHGLIAIHGTEDLPVQILGLTGGRQTHGHRFEASVDPIELKDADHYAEQLETQGAVIASFDDRRREIARQLQAAASKQGLTPIDDALLLDEVTALVERPNVLLCRFEPEFLAVPQECLILTMKANQKYFPLLDAVGRLTNQFLVVSNIRPSDPSRVIEGNERVVRPRLADAKFFFDQDRKRTLESRVAGLDKVVYHGKLGSQRERTERVRAIARAIGGQLGDAALARSADRAALLAKADLLTDMVGEFPELQGVMGGYYARHDGETEEVAFAIEDHYKPRFSGDDLPRELTGVVVALADKLETLVGLFGVGQVPTGDKDPFALRRHALGVIRLLVERKLPMPLDYLLDVAFRALPTGILGSAHTELSIFILDRFAGWLREQGYSAQEIDSVLARNSLSIDLVPTQLAAVRAFTALPEAASLAAANKRIANILKKSEGAMASVDEGLFVEVAERHLTEALNRVRPLADSLFERGEYGASLRELAALKAPVDAFFESVMVNSDDPALRANRLGLLAQLHAAMNRVADLSKLAS